MHRHFLFQGHSSDAAMYGELAKLIYVCILLGVPGYEINKTKYINNTCHSHTDKQMQECHN
jgi:hypothetical protein